jgi:hypothetical protein
MKGNINALAESVFTAVKGYCDVALQRLLQLELDPIKKRIEELPVPKDGCDGRDADPVEIRGLVDEAVKAAVAELPPPKDGRDGADGASVDAKQIASQVTDEVLRALAEIPPPADGKNGADGKDGLNGKDADPDVIAALVEKLVQDAIGALPPPRDGKDGVDGKDGKDAQPEHIKAEVQRALDALAKPANGIDGIDGRDGRDGKAGEPGRDALQIDILPSIDHTRSYPRSTYAQFGGGLIRSTRTTDPIPEGGLLTDAGWAFIVRGISMLDMRQVDERTFEFSAMFNDGTVERKSFSVPVQIYRGVYVEGKTYERGDTVTWGGSQWHCDEHTAERPGDGGTWRLAVKRGRDGKDATVAEPRKPATVKIG